MAKTRTELKVINVINTCSNSIHVNKYVLLQVTTILMIACLLRTVLKQVHLMTRAKGVSVSRKHLHKLFLFFFLPFYYRLRFEMVIHTWRWILCHLSWLAFVVICPTDNNPSWFPSVFQVCHKHKFSLHKNCTTHRHSTHEYIDYTDYIYNGIHRQLKEIANRDLRWGSFYSPVPKSAPFEQMRHISRSKHKRLKKEILFTMTQTQSVNFLGSPFRLATKRHLYNS